MISLIPSLRRRPAPNAGEGPGVRGSNRKHSPEIGTTHTLSLTRASRYHHKIHHVKKAWLSKSAQWKTVRRCMFCSEPVYFATPSDRGEEKDTYAWPPEQTFISLRRPCVAFNQRRNYGVQRTGTLAFVTTALLLLNCLVCCGAGRLDVTPVAADPLAACSPD